MNKKVFLVLGIIIITLSLSMSFAATFKDVEGKAYEDAVDILSELNVVSGYPDDTYKPNNVVKRSEMAKLLVVAIGRENDVASRKGKTNFPDVSANHWASGYINIAVEEGLIKGYPDGRFAPDDTVTYAEAVTMLLRALGYGKVVDKSSTNWPTNYLTKAKELPVLDNTSITSTNAGKGADRGNVSILIWNTLQTGVCTITSENANGVVYGQGKKLLKLKHSKFTCTEKATVTDINLESKTITYTDSNGDKTTLPYDKTDIKKVYGKQVTIVYDEDKEEYKKIKIASTNKTISGDVDDITSTKIYIDDVAYLIPSSKNIKLIGIEDIADAEEAYITTVNGTVKYILAIGTEELYYGVVTNSSTTLNSNKAIKVINFDGDIETFELANQSAKFAKGDVIVYTLDSKDRLIVKTNKDVDDSIQIDSLAKLSIKLVGKTKNTFSSTSDFIVLLIDYTDYEITKLSSITKLDEETDSAIVVPINDFYVIIGFEYGLDEIGVELDEDDEDLTRSEAKAKLLAVVKKANALVESKYTIASYANVEKYLTAAENISTSKDSVSKIVTAANNLQNAINKLSTATTTDKNIRSAYSTLTSKIAEAKKFVKADYTTTTYNTLQTAITAGEKISITSTTVEKIQTATDNIKKAINGLETVVSSEQMKEARAKLDAVVATAKGLNKTLYTTESYTVLEKALADVAKIDYATATAADITKKRGNIEAAIEQLVTTEAAALEKSKEDLSKKIQEAEAKVEDAYTAETWETFTQALTEVKGTTIDGLTKTQIDALTKKLNDAIDELVTKADEERKSFRAGQLEDLIADANAITEEVWATRTRLVTWDEFKATIAEAEDVLSNKETKTFQEIDAMYDKLDGYIMG